MRGISHKTAISKLFDYIDSWRRSMNWSREIVVQHIVEAHDAIDGPANTGITFDPPTRDPIQRMKNNADTVMRWLDDRSKEKNLLSVNMLPSVLAGMPADLRIEFLNDYLAPLGLCVTAIDTDDHGDIGMQHLAKNIKESAEANHSIAEAISSPTIETLKRTKKEVHEAIESYKEARRVINAMIRAHTPTGRVINKLLHREVA